MIIFLAIFVFRWDDIIFTATNADLLQQWRYKFCGLFVRLSASALLVLYISFFESFSYLVMPPLLFFFEYRQLWTLQLQGS